MKAYSVLAICLLVITTMMGCAPALVGGVLYYAEKKAHKPTSYVPLDKAGGYSETQLTEDRWRVNFHGNAHTPRERVWDFCMLRCAEVTRDAGYHYFLMTEIGADDSVASRTSTSSGYTQGRSTGSVNVYPTYQGGASGSYSGTYKGYTTPPVTTTSTHVSPGLWMIIKCLHEEPPTKDAYDAEIIAQSVRQKYADSR